VLLEAQEIAHLPRHGHRRQQLNLGTRHDGIIDIEQRSRVIERALAAVDESEHGAEILCGTATALRGKPKVNDRPVAIDQRSDARATV
jgi:hypothetical protein